jgi:transcription elongation GreA/GreB family factor
MDKQVLLQKLVGELEAYFRAAQAAHAESTHEQSKAENKYDTRALEASYLAHGQARQAAEMEAAIAAFENLEARAFGLHESIGVGALVELEHAGERTFYFLGSKAGGMEVHHEHHEVLVITPQSPLGQQLQGKKQDDLVQLSLGRSRSKYRVVSVS